MWLVAMRKNGLECLNDKKNSQTLIIRNNRLLIFLVTNTQHAKLEWLQM